MGTIYVKQDEDGNWVQDNNPYDLSTGEGPVKYWDNSLNGGHVTGDGIVVDLPQYIPDGTMLINNPKFSVGTQVIEDCCSRRIHQTPLGVRSVLYDVTAKVWKYYVSTNENSISELLYNEDELKLYKVEQGL